MKLSCLAQVTEVRTIHKANYIFDYGTVGSNILMRH